MRTLFLAFICFRFLLQRKDRHFPGSDLVLYRVRREVGSRFGLSAIFAETKGVFLRRHFRVALVYYGTLLYSMSSITLQLINHLSVRGLMSGSHLFENYLVWLKWRYFVDPNFYFLRVLETSYSLPFRLAPYKRSNKLFHVPVFFRLYSQEKSFILVTLRRYLRVREENSFLNRSIAELVAFFQHRGSSRTIQALDDLFQRGIDNRSYVHFRRS